MKKTQKNQLAVITKPVIGFKKNKAIPAPTGGTDPTTIMTTMVTTSCSGV